MLAQKVYYERQHQEGVLGKIPSGIRHYYMSFGPVSTLYALECATYSVLHQWHHLDDLGLEPSGEAFLP